MPARRRSSTLLVGAAVIVIGVLALVVGVVVANVSQPTITASSTREGTDAAALVSREPAAGDDAARVTAWASQPGSKAVWLRVTWPRERTLDRVRIQSGADEGARFKTGALEFGDGSALSLGSTDGDIDVSFPARRATSVTLVVTATQGGTDWVELGAWRVESADTSSPAVSDPLQVTPSASSGSAGALTDGVDGQADQGAEWVADDGAASAWVQLDWNEPREVASVEIFGPTGSWSDPGYAAAAPLNGALVFDDGSRVEVSGIAGGSGAPTVLGFMPRMAHSVRLELARTIDQAEFGLREFRIHPRGVTPAPIAAGAADGYTATPTPAECPASEAGSEPGSGSELALICPSIGSEFAGTTEVRVAAVPGTELEASAWVGSEGGSGSISTIADAVADADGVARFDIDGESLPHGPIGIRIAAPGESTPLYIQLVNAGGVEIADTTQAPRNRTLVLSDDFSEPLSVEQWGGKARYAATKPAYWGGSEFGDAILADPAWGTDNMATLDGDYLRIRAENAGTQRDPYGWGRTSIGGLLSSMHVGGSGSAVQYGYFEARVLAPGGTGTWPAFWMQNTSSVTRDSGEYGEIDAVELYGHDTTGSCHSSRVWREDGDDSGGLECLQPNGFDDWALTWRTFGVDVRPDGIDYYIDGKRVVSHDPVARQDEPFFYMINLALGGGWPVDLAPTGGVADLYVDWIRVYV